MTILLVGQNPTRLSPFEARMGTIFGDVDENRDEDKILFLKISGMTTRKHFTSRPQYIYI